jgi:hypothetical protein
MKLVVAIVIIVGVIWAFSGEDRTPEQIAAERKEYIEGTVIPKYIVSQRAGESQAKLCAQAQYVLEYYQYYEPQGIGVRTWTNRVNSHCK